MRGAPFHNGLARQVQQVFERFGWRVWTERRIRANGVTTYVDLYAVKGGDTLACEIETTDRHALDNAQKAGVVGIPLWLVAPTRQIKRQIVRRLDAAGLTSGGQPIHVLLLGDLETELARRQTEQQPSGRQSNEEKQS